MYDSYTFVCMRTNIILKEDLFREASELTRITGKTELVHEGLKALVERESRRRLAALGGTEKGLRSIPRRRSSPKK